LWGVYRAGCHACFTSLTEVTFLSTIRFWGEGGGRSHRLDRLGLRQIPAQIRSGVVIVWRSTDARMLFHPLVLGTQKRYVTSHDILSAEALRPHVRLCSQRGLNEPWLRLRVLPYPNARCQWHCGRANGPRCPKPKWGPENRGNKLKTRPSAGVARGCGVVGAFWMTQAREYTLPLE